MQVAPRPGPVDRSTACTSVSRISDRDPEILRNTAHAPVPAPEEISSRDGTFLWKFDASEENVNGAIHFFSAKLGLLAQLA